MTGFFKRMFGAPETVKQTIDIVAQGLDKIVYTDEEKAEDNRKDVTQARAMMLDWIKATQGQNLSRRFIAITTTVAYFLCFLITYIAGGLAAYYSGDEESIKAIENFYLYSKSSLDSLQSLAYIVFGFYFGGPYLKDFNIIKKER